MMDRAKMEAMEGLIRSSMPSFHELPCALVLAAPGTHDSSRHGRNPSEAPPELLHIGTGPRKTLGGDVLVVLNSSLEAHERDAVSHAGARGEGPIAGIVVLPVVLKKIAGAIVEGTAAIWPNLRSAAAIALLGQPPLLRPERPRDTTPARRADDLA